MKVYTLPKGLEAPEPDYSNYNHEKEAAAEQAHRAKVKDWLLKNGYPGSNTGRIYREAVADGHAEYMFADNGTKSALIHLPYGDGWQSRSVSGMSKSAILKLMAASESFDNIFKRADAARMGFWASRKVGEVLHYHNSFGQFIRGEVVDNAGKMELKPTALVGAWRDYDLPRRRPDGTVSNSYHVEKIHKGESWQPSSGCVYEAPDYSEGYAKHGDPRVMEAIDLSLPEMTKEQLELAHREKLIQHIVKQASSDVRSRTADDSEEVLQNMYAVLKGYFKA